jgi:hypothetical protein
MVLPEGTGVKDAEKANVVLKVSRFEQTLLENVTRTPVGDVCARLSFAVYDNTGIRKELVSQKDGDADFGTASLSLEEGDYHLVIVGHSGMSNPSFKANEKVSISGKNMTDTFWSSEELHVGTESVSKSLSLKRIVSLVRIVPDDKIPDDADSVRIGYRGSRGSFDGLTGYGSTTAQQYVNLSLKDAGRQIEFYMIPRDEQDMFDMTVETFSANRRLTQKVIEHVPVQRNCATICRGNLFDNESNTRTSSVSVTVDDTWDDPIQVTF